MHELVTSREDEAHSDLLPPRELFQDLLEAAPDAMTVVNSEGFIRFVNAQTERLFGYKREELLGKPLETLVPHRFRELHLKQRRNFINNPKVRPMGIGLELFGLKADGSEIQVEISLSPLRTRSGLLIISAIRDVTQRKEIEKSLKETDERFRLLVEGVRDYAIIMLDPQGHVMSWNEGAKRLQGYRADEILGKHISAFYTPEDVKEGKPFQHLETARKKGVCESEFRRVRKDGSVFWGHSVLRALKDGAGNLEGFSKITKDISERIRQQEEIKSLSKFPLERRAPVLRVTLDGIILYANPASEALFETWKSKERLPESLRSLLPQVLRSGAPKDTEFLLLDGRTYLLDIVPIVDEGYLNIYAADVTRRVQAENALSALNKDLEERIEERTKELNRANLNFKELVEHIREVFYLFDPKEKRFRYLSPVFEEIWSRSPQSVFDDSTLFYSAIHPEDRAKVEAAVDRQTKGENTIEEYRLLRADGSTVWILDHSFPILTENGEVQQVAGIAEDITDRKQAEMRLLESEGRFRVMADSSPVLLWVSGKDSLCDFFNQQWLEFTGKTMQEEVGVGWAEGVHPEDLQNALDVYMRAFNGRKPFEMVYRLRRWDGEYRWLLDHGVPRFGAGGVFEGFIGSCIDITDRKNTEDELKKMAERLTRSNEELERYAYIASHDLQEPIRTIINFTQLLSRRHGSELSVEAREYMGFILSNGNRMTQLIRDLLSYARVDKRVEKFREVDAFEVLKAVQDDLKGLIAESKALIIAGSLPRVLGDKVRLHQVFLNLLANALKFRKSEPPVIHISAERDGEYWKFAVQDNGIGIDMANAERLFQAFNRLHTRSEYPGSGIGLAVCKKMIDLHKGRIWVESEVEKGTTFYFTLLASSPSEDKCAEVRHAGHP